MNINRRTIPGMKVRKFHNGGKGLGHPHEGYEGYPTDEDSSLVPTGWSEFHEEQDEKKMMTTEVLDSILNSKSPDSPYRFSDFRNVVRSHEGGNQGYSAIQKGGGPGRGGYQFDGESAKTGYNRLKAIAEDRGYEIPTLTSEDFKNMDRVSPEMQDLLFTAHFAKDTASSVESVLNDKTQWPIQWKKGHWKGNESDWEKRRESFLHTLGNLDSDNKPVLPVKFLD
tara:strand:+ start:624 stop:1298 length:675 start_codon:yes stop_codon:yes gene_type:complete